jgi:hypothetical protein
MLRWTSSGTQSASRTKGHAEAVPGEEPEHAAEHEEVLHPIADDDDDERA